MVEQSYATSEVSRPRPELSPKPIDKRPMIYGGLVAFLFLLVFIGLGVWLFLNPDAAAVLRDIFIIYLGIGAFLIILLLIVLIVITAYLVIKINDLVQLTNREIRPVLLRLQETMGSVRGTTAFLSEQAAQPVIKTASTVAAIRAITRSLFRRG